MDRVSLDGEEGVRQLAYFRQMQQKRAWIARVAVLAVVLGLLVLNVYLMFVTMNTVVLNIDLARIEQSDQADLIHARIVRVERHVAEIEMRQLALLPEQQPAPAELPPPLEPQPWEDWAIAVAEAR